jgi:phospholipid/cholesterol/gamma-HCH transport system substrate-binding protein
VTAARGVALGALALALVVLAVVLLRSGGGHDYTLVFENAGQLVRGDDVDVGGRRIGSVTGLSLSPRNQAQVKVSVDDSFGPLHAGTTATIRATSLSGVANRYIELRPGANNAPRLDDGATLGTEATTSIVDLDQIFNTLDAPTRRALQQVIHGSATSLRGRERLANQTLHYINPAISSTARLARELDRDTPALETFLVSGSRVVGALAQRRGELTSLVSNANRTAGAIAAENSSLASTLELLPPTLRRANTTFVNLRATLDDLERLVGVAKPATRRLAPLLADLRPLVARARPTIADLRRAIRLPGAGNDLIDLERELPGLARLAVPTFGRTVRALRRAQPVLEFARPYAPELVGWLRDFGQGAASYDANGHYARIEPVFNAFRLTSTAAGAALVPGRIGDRLVGMSTRNFTRCPGSASQARPDGGNPWRDATGDLDCDPGQVPPGP